MSESAFLRFWIRKPPKEETGASSFERYYSTPSRIHAPVYFRWGFPSIAAFPKDAWTARVYRKIMGLSDKVVRVSAAQGSINAWTSDLSLGSRLQSKFASLLGLLPREVVRTFSFILN